MTTSPAPEAPAEDPRVGLLLGNYQILRRLGRGGMGVVYEAQDHSLQRRVAVKLLAEDLGQAAEYRERFLREARAISHLSHPNIIRIFAVDHSQGLHFIVMEYVEGESAQERLRRHGALPWAEATRIAIDVCRGLSIAHQAQLIHRDIKPANILVTEAGAAKLGDFGLVKRCSASISALTASGDIMGTPHYMSPEQCQAETLDVRTDLYSLGATYFALLTGRPPFDGDNPLQVMFAHCSRALPDLRVHFPLLPAACAALVEKAMAKKRSERYGSVGEMLADLENLLQGAPMDSLAVLGTARPARAGEDARTPLPRGEATPMHALGGARFQRLRRAFAGADSCRPDALVLPLQGEVETVAFSPDGRWLAAGQSDGPGGALLWDLGSGKLRGTFGVKTGKKPIGIRCLAFSPDSQVLAAGRRNGRGIKLWHLETGQREVLALPGKMTRVRALAFSPNGKWLASGQIPVPGEKDEVFLHLWRFSDSWKLRSLREPAGPIRAVAFFPFALLAAAGSVGHVFLYDVAARQLKQKVPCAQHVLSLAFVDAHTLVLAGANDRGSDLFFLDVPSEKVVHALPGKKDTWRTVAVSPDGQRIAAALGRDIVLLDATSRAQRAVLVGHQADVAALAFSPDGEVLASGGLDKTVRLWDLEAVGHCPPPAAN